MKNGKKYYITDMAGNFYKIDEKGKLVMAKNSSEATEFSINEANERIGTGKRARYYSIIEVIPEPKDEPKTVQDNSSSQVTATPQSETQPMFNGLDNDWETIVSSLCFMSSHMKNYQERLSMQLSDVDKEITDVLHYLEFNDLDNAELAKAGQMLQERRRHRREIKLEMDRTAVICDTFLDKEFEIKTQNCLDQMEKLKTRQYTPRKLTELFESQVCA